MVRTTRPAFEARTRRDLLHHTRMLVTRTCPRWGHGDEATVVVRNPRLTRDDVWTAFDQICEKLHVQGVDLEVEEDLGAIRAHFRHANQ